MKTYIAYTYPAEGSDEPSKILYQGSFTKCREHAKNVIKAELGLERLFDKIYKWSGGPDDIEAYHRSWRPNCGGIAIRLATHEETTDAQRT